MSTVYCLSYWPLATGYSLQPTAYRLRSERVCGAQGTWQELTLVEARRTQSSILRKSRGEKRECLVREALSISASAARPCHLFVSSFSPVLSCPVRCISYLRARGGSRGEKESRRRGGDGGGRDAVELQLKWRGRCYYSTARQAGLLWLLEVKVLLRKVDKTEQGENKVRATHDHPMASRFPEGRELQRNDGYNSALGKTATPG